MELGQFAGGAGFFQVPGAALEELLVGEHAKAGGAVGGVAGGNLRRLERIAQHALAGAGFLDFGNHGGLALRHARAQGLLKAPQPAACLGVPAHRGQVAPGACGGDLFALNGDDAIEDVGHGCAHVLSLRVQATNWLSLARARPDATASRACRTPSATEPATPAQ